MGIEFKHQPGRRERHLRRRHENPLFHRPPKSVDPDALAQARRADEQEAAEFMHRFQGVVDEAIHLKPSEGSEAILDLKERMDKAFEQAAGLGDDQSQALDAIRRLVGLIMGAVRQAAGNDPLAQQELAQEELAREAHYQLLQSSLVADLLDPESVIGPDHLVPTLLSESEAGLDSALNLFDGTQLAIIARDARVLMDTLSAEGYSAEGVVERMGQIESALNGRQLEG